MRETDEVQPHASLKDDLGADSLDAIDVTMALEESLNIVIPDDEAETLQTVGDVVSYLERRVSATT